MIDWNEPRSNPNLPSAMKWLDDIWQGKPMLLNPESGVTRLYAKLLLTVIEKDGKEAK